MQLIRLFVATWLGGSLIGICATAHAQVEPIVPPVRMNDQEAPAARTTGCLSLEELGYEVKELNELSLNIDLVREMMPPDCATAVFRREKR